MSVAWLMVFASWGLPALYSCGLLYSKGNEGGLEEFLALVYCLGRCYLIFNTLWGTFVAFTDFLFPCAVMVGLYTKIFCVAKEHARKIEDISHCKSDRGRGGQIKRSEQKAAKTLSIVLCAYIFCWMPFFLALIIDAYTSFSTPAVMWEVFLWLGYFNSTLNPIIYGLFYPWFRKCFHLIVTLQIFNSNSSTINLFGIK